MASDNDTPVDLYIAAYADPDAAQTDWDAIKELAKQKTITVDGLVLVSRGMDGKIDVKDNFHTTGHGAAWGAGAGLLVGLIFPPALLASGLVGAAAGAGVGGSSPTLRRRRSRMADNLNPVSRIYYSFSTFLCVARMVTSRSGNEQAARMGWEPERSWVGPTSRCCRRRLICRSAPVPLWGASASRRASVSRSGCTMASLAGGYRRCGRRPNWPGGWRTLWLGGGPGRRSTRAMRARGASLSTPAAGSCRP